MKQRIKALFASGVLGCALFGAAMAGPLEDARSAYQRGDYATAMGLLRPLADKGDAGAQNSIGWMYARGQGVPEDFGQALIWLRKAADQRNAKAQNTLGEMYERGLGVPQDSARAVAWYRKAADQGFLLAQFNLGLAFDLGRGVPQDYAQSAAWYRKAADQGEASAQFNIGVMYQQGQGLNQDSTQAVVWYRKAADQGYSPAQANLGLMYEQGLGENQDYAQALIWFRKAADQGNDIAQNDLGLMYFTGEGVPQDYAQAVAWYRKAADQGSDIAQNNLGLMYQNGRGVSQDYAQAYMWFNLAAARQATDSLHDTAAANRDAVAAVMSPGQIAEAQRMAREWKPNLPQPTSIVSHGPASEVLLERSGGTFVIPVLINGTLKLNFIIDSGASDVSIPADVVSTLVRTGALKGADFMGSQTYRLADGSTIPSERFRIRSLKVGNRQIENVTGSVAGIEGSLLLGQSFLERFRSWSIDNDRGVLLLN